MFCGVTSVTNAQTQVFLSCLELFTSAGSVFGAESAVYQCKTRCVPPAVEHWETTGPLPGNATMYVVCPSLSAWCVSEINSTPT